MKIIDKGNVIQIYDNNNVLRMNIRYKSETEYGYTHYMLHSNLGVETVTRFNSKGKIVKNYYYKDGRKLTNEEMIASEIGKWIDNDK